MPNDKELYRITNSSPEFETVGDFLNDNNSVAFTTSSSTYQKMPPQSFSPGNF